MQLEWNFNTLCLVELVRTEPKCCRTSQAALMSLYSNINKRLPNMGCLRS